MIAGATRGAPSPDGNSHASQPRPTLIIGPPRPILGWMPSRALPPRPLLVLLAVALAATTLFYSILWMISVRWVPQVELGFDNAYLPAQHVQLVRSVYPRSPAERAGLLPGDRIVAIDGVRMRDPYLLTRVWGNSRPGQTVRLTVTGPGRAGPVILTATFRARRSASDEAGWAGYLASQLHDSYPVPFVLVGLTVLFLRLEDPHAWLLALLFASFTAIPATPDDLGAVALSLRPFALAYKAVFVALVGPLFYFFFAVFPSRSPLDRRLPRLKWIGIALAGLLATTGLRTGVLRISIAGLWGEEAARRLPLYFELLFFALGLAALAANFLTTSETGTRRKIRVIFWGALLGVSPSLTEFALEDLVDYHPTVGVSAALVASLFIFPVSFAYAVVKHRVLEIPVLLKRSARYLLVQRGVVALLSIVSIALTLLFASLFARYLQPVMTLAQPAAIALGAVFGTVLLWSGSHVHKQVNTRIDRAFFRSAYDARLILEDLVQRTSTVTDRAELAALLEQHLREALQPSSLAVYLSETETKAISAADYVVPMPGRGGRPAGFLVLGPRLSEEPYSREDRRLLASVAIQAGTALENIRLAEEISRRMETERRVAREMEIAKEVQSRLLPQAPPQLRTLDCAAQCVQARSVGGDYFDFLELGTSEVGFVLADVSGKGVHAALLMASLQAHLRSQSMLAPLDPARLLGAVNRVLRKTTAAQHFATLFFAIYDDSTRRLTYVNCGHNAPMLRRRDGTVERLESTATVIGIFERWQCSVAETCLHPGDLLVIFSDGVTEAAGENDEEFGESRLIAELEAVHSLPAKDIVASISARVQEFSRGAQSDDLTLVVARAIGPPSAIQYSAGKEHS
jgi:sigma-B regulation protein RsbU (phosphoserine phosphatase)